MTSAVGLLPLSLHYGFDIVQSFLDGARSVDQHFLKAPAQRNIPIILGEETAYSICQSTECGEQVYLASGIRAS